MTAIAEPCSGMHTVPSTNKYALYLKIPQEKRTQVPLELRKSQSPIEFAIYRIRRTSQGILVLATPVDQKKMYCFLKWEKQSERKLHWQTYMQDIGCIPEEYISPSEEDKKLLPLVDQFVFEMA